LIHRRDDGNDIRIVGYISVNKLVKL